MALGSLSTGSSAPLPLRARLLTISPAMMMTSLLARQTLFPSCKARMVGKSPTRPTVPTMMISASG